MMLIPESKQPSTTASARHNAPQDLRTRQRLKSRHQYEKRKAKGLCGYSGCSADAAAGHKYCSRHLAQMSKKNQRRWNSRKRRGICIQCGLRPQFWGVRCVVCRQLFSRNKDPLPVGARRALKLYREAELLFELEQRQVHARFAIRKLLSGGGITGDRARALYLFGGLDTGAWRTQLEVASLMNLSHERVRQLLYHSKLTVSRMLDGEVPWKVSTPQGHKPVRRKRKPSCPVPDARSPINVKTITACQH